MNQEYILSYTAAEIDAKLGKIDTLLGMLPEKGNISWEDLSEDEKLAIKNGLRAASVFSGYGAPTTNTTATENDFYLNLHNGAIYKCIAVTNDQRNWMQLNKETDTNLDYAPSMLVPSEVALVHQSYSTYTVSPTVQGELICLRNAINELKNIINTDAYTLKAGKSWLDVSAVNKMDITEIHFIKEYSGNTHTASWDAGINSGEITVYSLPSGILYICSNGRNKIKLNSDSIYLFADLPNLRTLTGIELLDAYNVTNVSGMFQGCGLPEIDLSSLCLNSVERAQGMFYQCKADTIRLPYTGMPKLIDKPEESNSCVYGMFADIAAQHIDFGGGLPMLKTCMFEDTSHERVTPTTLKTVVGNLGVKEITANLFEGCISLEYVNLGNDLTTIGAEAFSGCTSLKSISFGDNIKSIGSDAFFGCEKLKEVNISNIAVWCSIEYAKDGHAFNDSGYNTSNPLYYAKNLYLNGNLVSGDIVVPDGLTKIAPYSFYNCTKITSVTLPSSITEIGEAAFWNCDHLKTVQVGYLDSNANEWISELSRVDTRAFANCLRLEKISGFCNVEYIGIRAFVYTANLTNMDFSEDKLKEIADRAFYLSCAEDYTSFDKVATKGSYVTRKQRWGSGLTSIQACEFPAYKILLDVHHPENQKNYPDIHYATTDEKPDPVTGSTPNRELYVAEAGCMALAHYHTWQCIYAGVPQQADGKHQYNCFRDWWFEVLNKDGAISAEYDKSPNLTDLLHNRLQEVAGWKFSSAVRASADSLNMVISRLKDGKPTYISMISANMSSGSHAALIIGCTPDKKLIILDSNITGRGGDIIYVRPEDLFTPKTGNIVECNYNN